jgi:hypothetical protein
MFGLHRGGRTLVLAATVVIVGVGATLVPVQDREKEPL